MTVTTRQGTWVVPPQRAFWVPAGIKHKIEMSGAVSLRTLYLRTHLMKTFPKECFVVNVSFFLRELVIYVTQLRVLDSKIAAQKRLIGVMVDQLAAVSTVPLEVPLPVDPRALRVAEMMLSANGDSGSLEQMSKCAGASKRTIERLFQVETGMTFRQWRQQSRLLRGLQLLAAGTDVTTTALEVGYDSPSAFIYMFKRALGVTPNRYFRRQ